MADAKPIRIHHSTPAFRSTTKQINISILGEDEDVHIVSTPTAAHPLRVVSMHYNTPDGRPVSQFFREDGTPEEGVIDPKPQLLPDGPRWSPLDDDPAAEHLDDAAGDPVTAQGNGASDDDAYVIAAKLWPSRFSSYEDCRAFLETSSIRTKTKGQRRLIHAADWANHWAAVDKAAFEALEKHEGPPVVPVTVDTESAILEAQTRYRKTAARVRKK